MKGLLLLLLLPVMPVKAKQPDIQCPGQNTVEMRWCAAKSLGESNADLQKKLPTETFRDWTKTTQKVCAAAYAPYKQGTIYPQMVVSCDDKLNRALLEELKGLGD